MSISKTLLGNTRLVAESGETGWDAETTQILVDVIDIAGISVQELASGALVQALPPTTATPAASSTVTVTSSNMRISGSGGAVILDTTTPLTVGEFDGQRLKLQGTSNTNTVEIRDSGNADLNGLIILSEGTYINLEWVDSASEWREENRSN